MHVHVCACGGIVVGAVCSTGLYDAVRESPFFPSEMKVERKGGQSAGPVGSSVSWLAGQAFISSFITSIKHIDFSFPQRHIYLQ